MSRIPGSRIAIVAALACLSGCAAATRINPVNPAFPVNPAQGRAALAEMARSPVELERPVVVLGGYLDPGLGSWSAARRVRKYTGDERVLPVSFLLCSNFDDCRRKVIDRVDAAFPADDPVWTSEVDVVAISMGGLVARHAAAPPQPDSDSHRRLRVRRLFSISSPHRGARLAKLPSFLSLHTDMRSGSAFLQRLDEEFQGRRYQLIPYVRLGDRIVGSENAAPPGTQPLWVSNPFLQPAHIGAALDARIFADIALRLRGEPHFAERRREVLGAAAARLESASREALDRVAAFGKKRISGFHACACDWTVSVSAQGGRMETPTGSPRSVPTSCGSSSTAP